MISANRESTPYPVAPLGIAYIGAALKAQGHEVTAADLCFSSPPSAPPSGEDNLHSLLKNFSPQVIGISVRNLDNLTYPLSVSYLDEVEAVVKLCRESSSAPIVLGGSGYSLAPGALLDYWGADFGIMGEGEGAFPWLLEALGAGRPWEGVPGLVYRRNGAIETNPPAVIKDLDALSRPDRSLLDNRAYLERGGMGNLQTKRGCPFGCIYCTYPLLEGRHFRLRKPRAVAREMAEGFENFGINYFYIVDNTFNCPPEHAKAVCREIIRLNLPLRWTGFIHPHFFDRELLELMVKAGCQEFEFGTDSGAASMLTTLQRGVEPADIEKVSALCHGAGASFCHYLLLGGPGETLDTVKATLDLMEKVKPHAVIAMLGIRIYPGTSLAKLAVKEGMIAEDDPLIYPRFYLSPFLEESLLPLMEDYAARHRHWVIPGLNAGVSQKIMELLRKWGKRGPLWKLLGEMGRR